MKKVKCSKCGVELLEVRHCTLIRNEDIKNPPTSRPPLCTPCWKEDVKEIYPGAEPYDDRDTNP